MTPSPTISRHISPEPAALTHDEFGARYDHPRMPEKFEATGGKLFWNDKQSVHILAMLLEAVGLKRALALCPPEAVRAALGEKPR